ncbi:MAG: hypothetical protein MJZ24_00355 [Paludibacteraceae bacterium]|nr:hypothetical protein [Candidatus Physcocola equi]MCQ2233175.1 hypothetical protein [Paludibacteraceae bacterium]
MYQIKGDSCFSASWQSVFLLIFPLAAFVQFFFDYSLVLAIFIAVQLLIVAAIGWSAEYVYQFDEENKRFRKAVKIFWIIYGVWLPINPQCKYLSLQMYEQTYTYRFLNLYSTSVGEHVFTVRFINADGTYRVLLETSSFDDVPQIIKLCQTLSEIYQIPFKDILKEQVKKLRSKPAF